MPTLISRCTGVDVQQIVFGVENNFKYVRMSANKHIRFFPLNDFLSA